MSILKLFEEIASDTKRSHKLSILEKNKDNVLFLEAIQLSLNPYINFFIKKIPPYIPTKEKSLEWGIEQLHDLESRQVTGHAAIEHLRDILTSLSADDAMVIERIIGKDLRCGMAAGIVNAVFDGFIPTYPCLLARPYSTKNIEAIVWPAYSQLKADGVRANFHIDGEHVSICGRSGRFIELYGEMDDYLIELGKQFDYPVVIDGELVVVDTDSTMLQRRTGNGIINKGIKGTITKSEAKMVRAQIWDVIPLSEFHNSVSLETYDVRFEKLKKAVAAIQSDKNAIIQRLKGNTNKVWIIPTRTVNNLDEAQAHFQEMLSIGEEGTLLKNMCSLWEDGRSKHLIKFKSEKDCDLEVTGWNPGTGKFVGQVGSLICTSSDKKVEVSISGFPDDLRQEITDNIDSWIGSIVKILYNERIGSKSRADVDSLFLPRFAERRYDKHTADADGKIA